MADATVRWEGSITNPGSWTALPTPGQGTGIMYRANNATAVDTSNPIVIISGDTARSYEKNCRINISANGDSNTISNLKFYISSPADGSMGTGITQYYGFNDGAVTPVDTDSSVATTGIPTTANLVTWTDTQSTLPTTGTGQIGDSVVMQIDVADTAAHGSQTAQTYIARYDEV